MKILSLLTVGTLFFTACQATPTKAMEKRNLEIPQETAQLITVTTKGWNTKDGKLQRYQRDKNGAWVKVDSPIKVVVGRNGLGWGVGLHRTPKNAKYLKKEGDGRSPAGLFKLGNGFGYHPFKINFPYAQYRRTDHCVDDSRSKYYNTIIDSNSVERDYKSFEYMKLRNNLYKYGITVKHNPKNIAQSGSCIFMHIQSPTGKGTAGCTAMSEYQIKKILKWLDVKKNPLLLQIPKSQLSPSLFRTQQGNR